MFDLDKAVNDWCDKVIAHGIWEADKVDELKDHLYCLIEEQLDAGKTEQAAFQQATNTMGLPASDSNGRSVHARVIKSVCRLLAKLEGQTATDSPLLIAHAVIWASVMIATALVMQGEESSKAVFFILLMGWLGSYIALDGNKRSAKQEWACMKRKFFKRAG